MKKFFFIAFIILIVVIGIALLLKACSVSTDLPTSDVAKYAVIQGVSLYYTNDYTQGKDNFGNYVILNGYWDSSDAGTSWHYHNRILPLNERGGKISVTKR